MNIWRDVVAKPEILRIINYLYRIPGIGVYVYPVLLVLIRNFFSFGNGYGHFIREILFFTIIYYTYTSTCIWRREVNEIPESVNCGCCDFVKDNVVVATIWLRGLWLWPIGEMWFFFWWLSVCGLMDEFRCWFLAVVSILQFDGVLWRCSSTW